MARTAYDAAIETLQAAKRRRGWAQVTCQDELWRWIDLGSFDASGLDGRYPLVAMQSSATSMKVFAIRADGQGGVTTINPTNIANWTLGASGVIAESHISRRSAFDNAGSLWYTDDAALLHGPSTPYDLTLTLGVFTDYARRIEAVCWTPHYVIVAICTHRWNPDPIRTLEFRCIGISAGSVVSDTVLATLLQTPNTDPNPTDLIDLDSRMSMTNALDLVGDGSKLAIVATVGPRTVQFFLTNGVESEPRDVIQIDEFGGKSEFCATSMTKIAGLYYLTGRLKRLSSDNSFVGQEVFLTSSDCENWSVGEQNYMFDNTVTPLYYAFATRTDALTSDSILYAIGLGHVLTAPVRPMDYGGSEDTLRVMTIELEQTTNNADSGSVRVINDGSLSDFKETNALTLSLGYEDASGNPVQSQYARLAIDGLDRSTLTTGRDPLSIPVMDLGLHKLNTWHAPVDVDRWSSISHDDTLTKFSKAIAKTPFIDVTNDDSGLHSFSRNNPLIAYATCQTNGNGISKLRFRFPAGQADEFCLPYVAIIFGGTSDAKFNAILVPKTGQDGIWALAHAEWRKSALPPADAATATGGFSLVKDISPFRISNIYKLGTNWADGINVAQDVATITEASQTGDPITIDGDVTYEIALRIFGARLTVYLRTVDYGDANANERSTWTHIGSMPITDTYVRKPGVGREYVGFAAGADVFGTDGCPPALGVDGIESVITYAKDSSGAAWEWGSAYSSNADDNTLIVGGGIYRDIQFGKGLFISEDNTRVTVRDIVRTDGRGFDIFSQTGWDGLSPKTDATQWRAMLEPGVLAYRMQTSHSFDYDGLALCNTFGIGRVGTVSIGDEIIKYWQMPGQYAANSLGQVIDRDAAGNLLTQMQNGWFLDALMVHQRWCIPALGTDMSALTNWSYGGARPGENFGIRNESGSLHRCIDDPWYTAGMQVIFKGRGTLREIADDTKPFYVASQTDSSGTGGAAVITRPVTVNARILSGGTVTDQSSVVAHITGRGFYQTPSTTHPSSEKMLYYPRYKPVDANGNLISAPPLSDIANLKRFEHYSGLHNSAEDDIRFTCAMAGVRDTTFRKLYTGNSIAAGDGQTIDTGVSLADFVLDLQIDMGAYNTISFRTQGAGAAYTLGIGRVGTTDVSLQLIAPNSTIAVDKKLDDIILTMATFDITNKVLNGRLIVRKGLVKLEIEKQLIWVWNLDAMGYGAWVQDPITKTYGYAQTRRIDTVGDVVVHWNSSAHTYHAELLELSDEVENHVIDIDSDGGSAVNFVISERHVFTRSTPSGSIEFGKYTVRDLAATVNKNIFQDDYRVRSVDARGHMMISGAEFGEWIDVPFIRRKGYRFAMGNNRLLDTPDDSRREARYLVRLAKEYAEQRGINLLSIYPRIQPEDKVTLGYTAQYDVPSEANADYVVTRSRIIIALMEGIFRQELDLRKYEAL